MQIVSIKLYTTQLEKQKDFYSKQLGFPVVNSSDNYFECRAGDSVFRMVQAEEATPYHFAFNIPHNQTEEALAWLKSKVDILPYKGDELVDFDAWNAQAMYFHDVDGNIVEFIGRRDIEVEEELPFSAQSILNISEIGLAVGDIRPAYDLIKQQLDIPLYDGSMESFCAAGSPNGLFIIINKNKKEWIPTDLKADSSPFRVLVEKEGQQTIFNFEAGELQAI